MWMGKEAFISIYRYMTRYMERYHGVAYRTLFTLRPKDENCSPKDRTALMAEFRKMMQNSLRNSDIMVEVSDRQIFMLLPETKDYNIGLVVGRLLDKWNKSEFSKKADVVYETGQVHLRGSAREEEAPRPTAWSSWTTIRSTSVLRSRSCSGKTWKWSPSVPVRNCWNI